MKKSYSVDDISVVRNSADFVDRHERINELSEDDEDLDNRLIAEQYRREVDDMASDNRESPQQPGLNQGQILQCLLHFLSCYRNTIAVSRVGRFA